MNTPSSTAQDSPLETPAVAQANASATRPLYWSVRRELWENRSIYVAPLAAAAIVLFGFSIRMITLPERMRALLALDPERQRIALVTPYSMAAAIVMFTACIVALFYCLDALYGERRDRSVLFWKSLPVSDLTTVFSKMSVPLVVLPLLATAIVFATQVAMLALNSAVLAASGLGVSTLWSRLPLVQMWLIQPYGLAVHVLWHAPIYAWLLLVSAWARRAPFLWAVLPPLAIGALEKLAFGTSWFGRLLGYRVGGAMREAFTVEGQRSGLITQLAQLDPARFLTSSGLWIGLVFAAAFLAAAARLRRRRGPI
jgi:ABC-2 type transport system permease protein